MYVGPNAHTCTNTTCTHTHAHTCTNTTCTHTHAHTYTRARTHISHANVSCNAYCDLIPRLFPCACTQVTKNRSLGMKLDLTHYTLLPHTPPTPSHTHTCTPPTHVHPLVHPVELVSTLREARSSGNDTKATRVLAGALKQLRLSRLKPDSTLNAALTLLAKEDSKLFNNPTAIEVQWKIISKRVGTKVCSDNRSIKRNRTTQYP